MLRLLRVLQAGAAGRHTCPMSCTLAALHACLRAICRPTLPSAMGGTRGDVQQGGRRRSICMRLRSGPLGAASATCDIKMHPHLPAAELVWAGCYQRGHANGPLHLRESCSESPSGPSGAGGIASSTRNRRAPAPVIWTATPQRFTSQPALPCPSICAGFGVRPPPRCQGLMAMWGSARAPCQAVLLQSAVEVRPRSLGSCGGLASAEIRLRGTMGPLRAAGHPTAAASGRGTHNPYNSLPLLRSLFVHLLLAAPYEHDPLAPWQRPATAGGTAAVHGGLLPLTAAAEFVSWRPSPSPSPCPNTSLVVHADESVGSCSGPAQHRHQLTAALGHCSTATSCGDGTPAPEPQQQLATRPRCTAKRPRDAQPAAAAMVPPPARVVILSARILAMLAAAANRRRGLHPPAALAPEGSADNFGGDCSEADSGSVRSAKRRRAWPGLQAAAEYRSASEAARAAAALERSMG